MSRRKKNELSSEEKIILLEDANKDLTKLNKKLSRQSAFEKRIITFFQEKIIPLSIVQTPKKKLVSTGKDEEEAIILLSDSHVGEIVSSDEMNNLGDYDFDIFEKRMDHLVKKTIEISGGHGIRKIHVFGLGDYVSGIIHDELAESGQETIIEWVTVAARSFSKFLLMLAGEFDQVQFVSVVGNHGRLQKQVRYKRKYANWDFVTSMLVREMISDQKNIKCNIPKSFFTTVEVMGKYFLLMHGDSVKSYRGVPYYGVERAVSELYQLLDKSGLKFDYVFMGHYHSPTILSRVNGECIMNGSIIGGNEFSLGALHKATDASQWLLGVHPKQGVSWRYLIKLGQIKG